MTGKVAVIGAAYTKFDEHWEKSLRDLSTEAGGMAIRQMALNLFPWLALLGICLAVVAIVGALRPSRTGAPRES